MFIVSFTNILATFSNLSCLCIIHNLPTSKRNFFVISAIRPFHIFESQNFCPACKLPNMPDNSTAEMDKKYKNTS